MEVTEDHFEGNIVHDDEADDIRPDDLRHKVGVLLFWLLLHLEID
jgi:hypothetical protein